MMQREAAAAQAFESRWTRQALRRADPELHQALEEQGSYFQQALVTGEDDAIVEHGEAMIRGWQVAVSRMASADEEDDAYLIGEDPKSGTTVAISRQRASGDRVRELHGERVIFLTPDEVAAMFAGLQTIATVKALWHGAEITGCKPKPIERYPDEPAQEE